MDDTRQALTRRAVITTLGLFPIVGPAFAAKKATRSAKAAPEPTRPTLAYPRLVDLVPGETFDLVAEPATHAFQKDKPVLAIGYGGTYMGPALRVKRGTTPRVRLVNRLDRPTNVHWHGALIEGRFDGGTHPGVAPGGTWEATLALDQPAATLWYHAHVHGSTTQDVHDGLCGLLIVDDPAATAALGLPSTWGVDDLPLVLQDRDFDPTGRPVRPPLVETLEHGFRGRAMIVNGQHDAVARVPSRLVRLRLLNASGARVFRLAFEDRRPFRLIACDAGLLPAPVELDLLVLAPGERAEILVDFAEGAAALVTSPDLHEHRDGHDAVIMPDVIEGQTRILAFDVVPDERPRAVMPKALVALPPLPVSTVGLTRRRFELRLTPIADPAPPPKVKPKATPHAGHGARDHAAPDPAGMTRGSGTGTHDAPEPQPTVSLLTINGRTFAMDRIDERVPLGATEVWEIVSPEMAHPFHVHGAHFRVLGEDGGMPKAWNGGLKDTVLVTDSAELLVTFTRRAGADAPFVYHCHLLEHEDGGMMGAFTVE